MNITDENRDLEQGQDTDVTGLATKTADIDDGDKNS
jgi:hypothetical protein